MFSVWRHHHDQMNILVQWIRRCYCTCSRLTWISRAWYIIIRPSNITVERLIRHFSANEYEDSYSERKTQENKDIRNSRVNSIFLQCTVLLNWCAFHTSVSIFSLYRRTYRYLNNCCYSVLLHSNKGEMRYLGQIKAVHINCNTLNTCNCPHINTSTHVGAPIGTNNMRTHMHTEYLLA